MSRILPVPGQPRARLPVLLTVAVLAAVLVAGGCGLKGDLYLPEPEPETPAEQSGNGSEDDRNDSDDDEADT